MRLGIDVGGTHTDAVIVDQAKGVIAKYKVKTLKEDLLGTIIHSLKEITANQDISKITNVNLSTTLSTNAIVENRLEETALFLSSGPGIDPENFAIGNNTYIINGSIDHRGSEVLGLDSIQLKKSLKECADKNIKVFAAATKFSTRNNKHELAIKEAAIPFCDYITMGHEISGLLSFPRRAATAYYNSAVWRIYNNFINSVIDAMANIGIKAPLNILKADGGTMPLEISRRVPVESILSGPAASIMGIIALCNIKEDSVILDIGGTTTDIAIFAAGSPLVNREGAALEGTPTLVRSLENRSIGIGGDSAIKIENGKVVTGPERFGPCMADGGNMPCLIDALNFKKIIQYNNRDASERGIIELAKKNKFKADHLADAAINFAAERINAEIEKMLFEINSKPVYTIHDMIHAEKIIPKKIYIIGGPAKALADVLSGDIEILVPEDYDVANAIGAALARTTFETELFCDTGKGKMIIPNINVEKNVTRQYNLDEAISDAKTFTREYLRKHGIDINLDELTITEATNFRMINDFYSAGNDIRVKCQMKPNVVMYLHK